jgi:hydrophobe/amphiphile efflux-3 (HAE3) family protein
MQRFWSWLAVNLARHAGMVTLIGLVFTVVLGVGITRIEFATGQDSYLNKGSQVYDDNIEYQELFGGNALLTAISMDEGHTVDELFTEAGVADMERVATEVREVSHVLNAISPVTALEFSSRLVQAPEGGTVFDAIGTKALTEAQAEAEERGDTASVQARAADLAVTSTRLLSIPADQQSLTDPAYVQFLLYDNTICEVTEAPGADEVGNCPNTTDPAGPPQVGVGTKQIRKALVPFFPDPEHAVVVTRYEGNLDIKTEGESAVAGAAVLDTLEVPDATTVTAGASLLLKDINDYLTGGMLTLGGIAVAVMIVILMLFFHVRWRLLPLAVVLVGIVWAFGLAGFLGIPLTVVTIAGLPVMLGIGIDYAIQMHSRIEEEVVIDRAAHPIQEAARGLGPGLLVVTFDAVFAFLAIQLSQVPMIREFGWLLTVGIVMICISSIVNPLAILGIREYKSPTTGRDYSTGRMGRLVVWLGSAPAATAVWLALVAVVVFAVGSYLEPRQELETDPIKWLNPSSPTVQSIDQVDEEIGGSSELGVYVQSEDSSDLLEDQGAVDWASNLVTDMTEAHPEALVYGSSIVSTVTDLTSVEGAAVETPRAPTVQAAWGVAPEDIQITTMAKDGAAMNLVFFTGPVSLEERAVVVDDIESVPVPDGLTATPSGLAVVGVGLLENLEANLVQLTWLAAGLVFLFLWVRLRSFTRAILSMVPVLISSGVATIVIWALGIQLSPMTAVGGPLVVATCTEFTSLIVLRYIEERRRGLEPREAIDVTASRTGRAFIVSAMTAIAGVAVIAFSSLPLLRNFGIFVALKIAIALLAALVVLPPLIVWADKRNWVSRGMVEHEDQPYIEVPRSEAEARALAKLEASRTGVSQT